MHQCCYCEQMFDSEEQLYEHVEIHSDIERNKEVMDIKNKPQRKIRHFSLN